MKGKWDEKGKFKNFCEGDLVLWMPKSIKIKGGKFKQLTISLVQHNLYFLPK
jgi:hypothetical protein